MKFFLSLYVVYAIFSAIGMVLPLMNWVGILVASASVGYLGVTSRKQIIDKYKEQGIHLKWQGEQAEFFQWCLCSVCSLCQEYRTVMNHVDVNGDWVKVELPQNHGEITAQPELIQPIAPMIEVEMKGPEPVQVNVHTDNASSVTESTSETLPSTMPVMPLMPPGWVQELDAQGKTYYYNAELHVSTYEHPALKSSGGDRTCCGY